ncbi:alpha/beta fold hydrolase [Lysobacter sp. CFH 32150]|uniref:alpha/beta hydrolase n=1 Tax=Lysobacter sp. CFH 32150 TaxID=2927128 RepID=UPI001FA7AAB9|nr:alpha/beta fold hydrolase [Lysobacter sp. CFH 32150]MCI4567991.1 alpha/beta hydrolase [Lysobacter sp. CFH 32150]
MSRKFRIVLVLLALAGFYGYRYYQEHAGAPDTTKVAAAKPSAPAPLRRLGSIAFTPCTLSPSFGAASVEAQCGKLVMAENPALPNGRKIALNIAWVPADDEGEIAPDPVFMLAGGPGQAATESYAQVAPAFREVLKKRHVLLVDQRGTGGSNKLVCKDDAGNATVTDENSDNLDEARRFTERCRDVLSKHADLRYYTTTDAIRDLDAVRKAIGAQQINLVGISYGTRVAQQYALRYPAGTRTIVLDSVAPNTLIFGNDFAANLEAALDLQFGQCGKSPACAKALGNPRSRLDAVMAKLRSDPPLVRYRDASTGELREEKLLPGDVAGLARMYAYVPVAAALLPLQLNEAANGRYDGLMALAKMLQGQLSDLMAFGMQLSVVCSEDAAGLKANPGDIDSLLGNQLPDFLKAQCAVWPRGTMPKDFHTPLATKVPALLLSGEFDPVTPPRYGDEVVKTLANGRHLVLRGQGHNVIGAGCMPKLFAQFIDTANAKALDAKCLETLAYTPPFTSFNGWEP